MVTFIAPVLNYGILAPILIVLGGALIGVLVEAFAPRKSRSSSQLFIAVVTLVIALATLLRTRGVYSTKAAMSSITFDGAGTLQTSTTLNGTFADSAIKSGDEITVDGAALFIRAKR